MTQWASDDRRLTDWPDRRTVWGQWPRPIGNERIDNEQWPNDDDGRRIEWQWQTDWPMTRPRPDNQLMKPTQPSERMTDSDQPRPISEKWPSETQLKSQLNQWRCQPVNWRNDRRRREWQTSEWRTDRPDQWPVMTTKPMTVNINEH